MQTHSGYQPLKNNIKGRTKNTDSISITSKGRESGAEAGQRGKEAGWGWRGRGDHGAGGGKSAPAPETLL